MSRREERHEIEGQEFATYMTQAGSLVVEEVNDEAQVLATMALATAVWALTKEFRAWASGR